MASTTTSLCSLSFTLSNPQRYGPRLGNLVLRRQDAEPIQLATPGLLTTTSRGVVPHLSRDNHKLTDAIRWVNIPFETFLEHKPPVPTLQPGANPLHTFLGFVPGRHLLSMSARDPADSQEMPPNGNTHVSVMTLRGVRKLSPADWRSYVLSCKPDVVFAVTDTPFTDPPYSQKRMTKSIERSAAWLSGLVNQSVLSTGLAVLVNLAGGTSIPARKAFADSLLEKLYGPEAEAMKPLQQLDDGVAGYSVDLVPLRQSFDAIERKATPPGVEAPEPDVSTHATSIVPLIEASLSSLPSHKIRVLNSTKTPHEILHYISTIGIDVFDADWAQKAANIGVALDFEFPVVEDPTSKSKPTKREIGHNLYEVQYRRDYGQLSGAFRGVVEPIGPRIQESQSDDVPKQPAEWDPTKPVCPCATCSPVSASSHIHHGVDTPSFSHPDPANPPPPVGQPQAPFSRAYIHHLLHTHEMSAHSLLAMHNLTILDLFFVGIREVLQHRPEDWEKEVKSFGDKYGDDAWVDGGLFARAAKGWRDVDLARGKGRLARGKENSSESDE